MAAVLSPTATSFEVKAPSWGVAPAALGVVLAVVVFGYHVTYMQADKAYLMSRIASQGTERTANAQRAVQLNPYNDMYRAEVGLALMDETLAAVNALASGQGDQQATLVQAQDAFRRAELSLKETIAFVPWEYDNYVFLANLYNLGGQFFDPAYYEQAIEISEKGVEVEEFGPAIRFQYARALQGADREGDAIEQLETAVGMDPAYNEAATLLASIYETRGELDEAIRVLRTTEEWRPGLPGIAEKLASLESSITTP
jgi:tetratricopeptide (TPR) repeat protein